MIITPALIAQVAVTQIERNVPLDTVMSGLRNLMTIYDLEHMWADISARLSSDLFRMRQHARVEIIVARETDITSETVGLIMERHSVQDSNCETTVVPDIIGGYILRSSGVVYDNSIRQRIDQCSHLLQA